MPCSAPRHHNPDAGLPAQELREPGEQGALMPTSGELIRLLGYVDDIAATLHRIDATIPTLTPEERKRLAEYMRKSEPKRCARIAAAQRARWAKVEGQQKVVKGRKLGKRTMSASARRKIAAAQRAR